jgi:hypothetical protein
MRATRRPSEFANAEAVLNDAERCYRVCGNLIFEWADGLPITDNIFNEIHDIIMGEIGEWYDISPLGVKMSSIARLSEGRIATWGGAKRYVHFWTEPECNRLKSSQLHAYQKFISGIAKKLAEAKIQGVVLVIGRVETEWEEAHRV